MGGYVVEAVGTVNGRPGEWAGKVIPPRELGALLARFGMIVGLDTSPKADEELQSAQMAHALLGAAEAHATRAEQAYRDAGAEPPDITQASRGDSPGKNHPIAGFTRIGPRIEGRRRRACSTPVKIKEVRARRRDNRGNVIYPRRTCNWLGRHHR